ncbi:unnamed protein product [Camellia sinensis]
MFLVFACLIGLEIFQDDIWDDKIGNPVHEQEM